jgi:hypothetical protein
MNKRFSKVMLAVILLSILTSVVVMTPFVKAQAILLSSSQGAPGSTVTLRVSGFAPSETVVLDLSLNIPNPQYLSIGSITADSNGSGSISFTVPNDAVDQYYVSATGQTSGYTAAEPFSIIVLTATSTTTPTPASTPSVPEFPIWTIPLLLILTMSTGLFVYFKKHDHRLMFLFRCQPCLADLNLGNHLVGYRLGIEFDCCSCRKV